ncbi:uroporphyrinogen decarboxylase family protein [Chloroflexota bacterium]
MTDNRSQPSPEQRSEEMFNSWLSPRGIEFASPDAEKSYRERVNRLIKVIRLEIPDRVPVYPSLGFFPAYYSGITTREAMYDYDKLGEAWKRYVYDFQPDIFPGAAMPGAGRAYEILDYKLYKWPGHGTAPNTPYQCVEAEYMKADEYDALIRDPSDFWHRIYLPRICAALEPLNRLSPFTNTVEMPSLGMYLLSLGNDDVQEALKALLAAGQEAGTWGKALRAIDKEVIESGFPMLMGGTTKAPFDTIGDTLRGTQQVILDMYRQPDKLIQAMEKLTPIMIEKGISAARRSGYPVIFIPLHKGADGFMSAEQYKKFYWPTLKEVILGLVNQGLVPYIFAEGCYNSRLEIIKDIPRGKTIWKFDATDMAEAKRILGETACIEGNVPTSLLSTASPEDIRSYCKKLIDTAGKGGGYIMSSGADIDTAKPENVRAMIEFTKEYGIY